MGKSSSNKRKRSDEQGDEDVARPAKKTQSHDTEIVGEGNVPVDQQEEKKSGEARQQKSERRSKKVLESKKISKKEETIIPSNGPDILADGADFVSLSDKPVIEKPAVNERAPSQPQATTVPSQQKSGKAKKASPRSIRKAAKGEKIASALAEEGLDAKPVAEEDSQTQSKNNARFICFVGNLPFTATTAQIEAHFAKIAPKSVRLSTDKATGKGKGFAFIEFDDYDRMKTCLKSYHQSVFEPNRGDVQLAGKSKKTQGRKLNVELTAGGGGNTQGRKEKIREKNNKLKEERATRKVEEAKEMQEKLKKRREQKEKEQNKRRTKGPSGANAEAMTDTRGIHPSRLNRVPDA